MSVLKSIYKAIVPLKLRNNIVRKRHQLAARKYKGENFYCPCCKKGFTTFKEKSNGIVSRDNAVCPFCMSLERTRLLYLYLQQESNYLKTSGKTILHFAPEQGIKGALENLDHHYIDADIHPAYAKHQIDIQDIHSFPDNYFDLIIVSHVLAHVGEEKKALTELLRVLKQDGEVLILTLLSENYNTVEIPKDVSAEKRKIMYGEADLQRLHGQDFTDRLSSIFKFVNRIDYRDKFSEEENLKMSLGDGKREIIFQCKKKSN